MKITIQTATRGREDILPNFVENIFSTCSNPNDVEMIFYIDEDDIASQKIVKMLPVRFIIGSRGKGYCDHPRFHTEMAKMAKGQLLMQANDDMLMMTKGWDTILWETSKQFKDDIYVLKMTGERFPRRMPFPIIHKRIVEIMGCFTPYNIPWIDRFLWTVMHRLKRFIPIESVITKHQRLGNYSYLNAKANPDIFFSAEERNKIQEKDVIYWVNTLGSLI